MTAGRSPRFDGLLEASGGLERKNEPMVLFGLLFAVSAADWISGSYILVGVWHRLMVLLAHRSVAFGPTPLADEIEDWLRGK
jgi:hypothetical protein